MNLKQIRSLLLMGCIVFVSPTMSQKRKLQLHATSLGFGYTTTSEPKIEGPAMNLEFSTIYNQKHVYSLHFNVGSQDQIFAGGEEFYELNLLYGRAFQLGPKFMFEGHVGMGIFGYEDGIDSPILDLPDPALGFPIRTKLLYRIADKFAIGINPNANFNSILNTYTGQIVLQYNFEP